MQTEDFTQGQKAALGGAVLTILGTFLPWAKALGVFSVSGLDGDGSIALVLAVGALAVVLFRDWEGIDHLGTAVLGVLVLIIPLLAWGRISGTELVSTGIGIWVTMLGGALLIAGGVVGYRDDRESAASQPVK